MSAVDPFERTSAGARKLVDEFNRASGEAGKLTAELSRQKSMADAFSALNIRPFKDIDADINQARAAYDTLKSSGELSMQALAQAKLKLSDRIQELKGQTNGWADSLYSARAGLAAVAASFAALGGAIKSAMDMEALSSKLKYATGSAEGAAQALKFTSDMANRLGIDSRAAADGFSGIAAAAKGTVLEGQKARDIFESIATASRVVGLTSDQMGGALLAVQQMMSKGVVSAEEFRGQLGERLPGATRIAAEALGVTEAQFAKMLETGQIVASDFLPKFSAAMLQAFGPDSQTAAQSTAAQFAILVNNARDLAVAIGTVLLPAVNLIAGALGDAARWAAEFAKAHPHLTALVSVGGLLAASWSTLGTALLALRVGLTGMMTSMMAAPAAFAGATTAATAFRAALGPLIVALTAGWEFGRWLNGFENVRMAGVFMVDTLVKSIEQLRWYWESFIALFTGDTVEQANLRHMQRLQEINAITASMYADATGKSQQSAAAREQDEAGVAAAAVASAEQQKAAYAGLNAVLQQQLAERLAAIQTYYATERAEVEASNLSQGEKQAAETQLFIADYTERLTAMKDFYAKSEELINLDANTLKAGIKAGSDAEKAVDAEILAQKQKLYVQAQASLAAHVDALNKEYYRHLDAVRDIEQQKLDFMKGAEAALRDIKMQGMSEYEKYSANLKEIDRLESEARRALKDGDLKKAQEYANEAIALARSQTKAVTSGDVEMVSSSQARYTAQEKIKKIMAEMAEGMDEAKDAEKGKADQVKKAWEDSQSQLESAKTTLAEITEELSQSYALTISSNASDVQSQINALTQPTSSTHTIYVQKVEQNATGGLVGAGIGRYASGGPVSAMIRKFATGGPVFRKPGWSKVPGSGNGDTEPALLKAGSFVVKKAASQYYGDGIMGAMARGVAKFAGGGSVSSSSSGLGFAASAGSNADNDLWSKLNEMILFVNKANKKRFGISDAYGQRTIDGEMKRARVYDADGTVNPKKMADLIAVWERTIENMKIGDIMFSYTSWLENLDAFHKFATGGEAQGSDTVPAMLTPEEWVIQPPAVKKYGSGFMDDINNMRIPREMLAGIGRPPQVARFASGGQVGGFQSSPSSNGESARTVTIKFAAANGASASGQFRRNDVQAMLDVLKQAGARAVPT